MKNLLNFLFSFDKLFKEKLIVPFFWLALITWGLGYFSTFVETLSLSPIATFVDFIQWMVSILFALVLIRLVSELAVAIFRINDNLSPDGGKSELADIDPIAEAKKAAEVAAARTREATRSVSEKASEATKSMRDNVGEMSDSVQEKAKSATASVREKTETVVETAKPSAPKKRGRPAGSKNKPKTAASKPAETKTTPKKRGPKPGAKVPRDADGNLLKKDGTPRKKPGPKKS